MELIVKPEEIPPDLLEFFEPVDPGAATNVIQWPTKEAAFSGAHYACFPPGLPAWCIKVGTSERGACPVCGSQWARVVERESRPTRPGLDCKGNGDRADDGNPFRPELSTRTTSWRPTCDCAPHDPVPATVLDCFGGAGTTALAADRLGRDCILIELNETYAEMARRRNEQDAGLFADLTLEASSAPLAPPLPFAATLEAFDAD